MRFSELLHREIATESGRRLGHVQDVRAEQRSNRLLVTGLVIGRRGLLEHFGIGRRRGAGVVPLEAVVRVSPGKVVVRDGTELER